DSGEVHRRCESAVSGAAAVGAVSGPGGHPISKPLAGLPEGPEMLPGATAGIAQSHSGTYETGRGKTRRDGVLADRDAARRGSWWAGRIASGPPRTRPYTIAGRGHFNKYGR